MAKNRKNQYRELNDLPHDAITVKQYARQQDCDTAYIYKLWKQSIDPVKPKEISFEIVKIRDINFVIPV